MFLIVLFPSLLFSQSPEDSLTFELSKLTGDSAIVGFAVAILNQDSILYAKGFGLSDNENHTPYTIKTVQPIASISKTLIGLSLLKAQELKMLNLNDDINSYLPFKIVNPHHPDSIITIKHLANHSSSLRDTKHYEKSYIFSTTIPKLQKNFPIGLKRLIVSRIVKGYNKNKEMPQLEFLRNLYVPKGKWYSKKNFLKTPPGHDYSYCNNGAAIASIIIEQVSGMKYTDFVKLYILTPLRIKNSGWELRAYDKKDKSKLYFFGMEIPEYKLITLADGGFITCIEDFSKYMMAVIRGYNGEDNIINSASYNIMLKENLKNDQGIFWCVKELDNDNYIGHTGGDPGINTIAIFDIRTNLGYICFSNTNTSSGEEIDNALTVLIKYSTRLVSK